MIGLFLVGLAVILGMVVFFARSPVEKRIGLLGFKENKSALEMLENRYANGEIGREEFMERKRTLMEEELK
jgi:uncharacterized membrane protein